MSDAKYIPSSSKEAKSLGMKLYFDGVPCKNGHISYRYACNRACAQCTNDAANARKLRAAIDPVIAEKMRESQRKSKANARLVPEKRLAINEANSRYAKRNKEKIRDYWKTRRVTDPSFRMAAWCRSVLHSVLSRANLRKDARCIDLLGYTGDELKAHIEKQFTAGMDWSKMGSEIHIDHIIPITEFLRTGETRPSVMHSLSNLRPMWAGDNISKRDKVLTLL